MNSSYIDSQIMYKSSHIFLFQMLLVIWITIGLKVSNINWKRCWTMAGVVSFVGDRVQPEFGILWQFRCPSRCRKMWNCPGTAGSLIGLFFTCSLRWPKLADPVSDIEYLQISTFTIFIDDHRRWSWSGTKNSKQEHPDFNETWRAKLLACSCWNIWVLGVDLPRIKGCVGGLDSEVLSHLETAPPHGRSQYWPMVPGWWNPKLSETEHEPNESKRYIMSTSIKSCTADILALVQICPNDSKRIFFRLPHIHLPPARCSKSATILAWVVKFLCSLAVWIPSVVLLCKFV